MVTNACYGLFIQPATKLTLYRKSPHFVYMGGDSFVAASQAKTHFVFIYESEL